MTRRLYRNYILDSTRWDGVVPRDDDIVIDTAYKAGTTWMQRIVSLLVLQSPELPGSLNAWSPWVDMRPLMPKEELWAALEAMRHRRFMKSHLPFDALPYRETAKYIYIGRDPRDVFMSMLNHYGGFTEGALEHLNAGEFPGPKLERFNGDARRFWQRWTTEASFPWESDGWPFWSHFHHASTWWQARHLPNLLLVHFADLKSDLEAGMRTVARFLGIDTPEALWPALVDAASFESMKRDGPAILPEAEMTWKGGARQFINKGTNGRWREILTDEDLELYDAACARSLTPALREWLEHGGAVAPANDALVPGVPAA